MDILGRLVVAAVGILIAYSWGRARGMGDVLKMEVRKNAHVEALTRVIKWHEETADQFYKLAESADEKDKKNAAVWRSLGVAHEGALKSIQGMLIMAENFGKLEFPIKKINDDALASIGMDKGGKNG